MNIHFKTHFPWPGADGQSEPTHFGVRILAAHGINDGPSKLHTIRRLPANGQPRYREGMKLVMCTGSRFKPNPFLETECTGTQTLWMEARPNLQGINLLIWVRDSERGPARLLTTDQVSTLAENDGFAVPNDFARWFVLDLLQNGLEATYQLVHWADVRY